MSPALASAVVHAHDHTLRPKFRSNGLHPELLRNPSLLARLYFYLFPFFTFYHIPLQTFFDFNAVFILLQCVYPCVLRSLFAYLDSQDCKVSQSDSTWCVRIWKELGTRRNGLHSLLAGLDHHGVCAL